MRDLDMFGKIVRRRRSVRAFLPDPVDMNLIRKVTSIAANSPSSCNTQPWKLHIVSGYAMARLRPALMAAAIDGRPQRPEVEYSAQYQGTMRERQIEAAVQLYSALKITRYDLEARQDALRRNYAFFDAPHAAFLFMHTTGGLREAADCSKFAQTFMLALTAAGIGSCAQGSLCEFPEVVREVLELDEPGRLLLGISFGYPDEASPTVTVRPPRRTTDEIATFHNGVAKT